FPDRSLGATAGGGRTPPAAPLYLPSSSRRARVALDFHQQTLGLGVLDAVDQLAALVVVAHGLGHGDAGLHQHQKAHGEIALDRQLQRQEPDANADHERGGGKRDVGEGDPGGAVLGGGRVVVHGSSPCEVGLRFQLQFDTGGSVFVRLAFSRASTSSAVDLIRGPKPCSASFSAVASGPLAASSSISASSAAAASIWRSRKRLSVASASGSVDS